MARGYVGPNRNDTALRIVFSGMSQVTHADVNKLFQNNLKTAGEFAKAASDGDLTDNGMTSEESIRLITAFEQSEYRNLLDYADLLVQTPADVVQEHAQAHTNSNGTQPIQPQISFGRWLWNAATLRG